MASPTGLALDGKGNLYVADQGNNRVLCIPASLDGLGTPVTVLSGLSRPAAVAADWSGNVYVADTGNNRILMLPVTGTGFGEAIPVASDFSSPSGIAVDAWGNLYVSDAGNNRVVEVPFTSSGYAVPIPVVLGLSNPSGLAIDSARTLYIADTGNNRVIKESYSPTGYTFKQAIGYGLKAPIGVSVDRNDNVYIADTGNGRVLAELWFAPAGRYNSQTVVGSNFDSPQALGEDLTGKVYVADSATSQVLAIVSTSNEFSPQNVGSAGSKITYNFNIAAGTVVAAVNIYTQGVSGKDFQDAGGSTCYAQTYAITTICGVNIAFTPLGSGTRAGSVVLFDPQGNILAASFLNGTGLLPQAAYIPGYATLLGSQLSGPAGVTVDGSGNLFIADTGNNRVVELPWNGTGYGTQTTVPILGLVNPMGMAVDGAGSLYVASNGNDKVLKLPWMGAAFGPQLKVANGFYAPTDVAVDGYGNVYVTNTLDNEVVELPWAGNKFAATQYIGNYHRFPGGLAVDGSGNVYFANPYMSAVEEVPWGGTGYLPQRQIAVPGISFPSALAVDGNSNLYILDAVNNEVVMLPWEGSHLGSPIPIANGFNAPQGMAIDSSGNLYVADTGNNQVVKIALSTPAQMSFTFTYLGSTSADSAHTTLVENIGNQALILNSVSYPPDFPEDQGATNPCVAETSINQGDSCELSVDFTPQIAGSLLNESVQVINNSMGIAATQQSIPVSGSSAGKLAQTINFPTMPSVVYGTGPIPLAASTSSGLPIAYAVLSGPATLTNQGSVLNVTGAGTIILEASQGGSSIYAQAQPVPMSLVVNPATLTVTPYNLSVRYGSVPKVFAYSISGFVLGQTASQTVTGTAAVATGANVPVDAGTYTLLASIGSLSAANYTFAFASATLTVSKAVLHVSAVSVSTVYGASEPAFGWSLTGFVNGDSTSAVTGAPVMTPGTSVGAAVGSYPITPTLGTLASANYSFLFSPAKLTITPAVLTVSVVNQNMRYGANVPALSYRISGFVQGDTEAGAVTGMPTIVSAGAENPSVGRFAISASLGTLQASNYVFSFVPGVLTVSKAMLTLLPNDATMIYGNQTPRLSFTITGFVNRDAEGDSCSGAPTTESQATSHSVPGTFAIASGPGTLLCRNYAVIFGSGILTIEKAPLIVVPRLASMTYGAALPSFAYDYSGFVNGDGPDTVTGYPSFSTTATSKSPVGSYPIIVGNGNLASAKYTLSSLSGVVRIGKALLTVTPNDVTMTYGGAWPKFSYAVRGLLNGDGAGVVTGSPLYQAAMNHESPVGSYLLKMNVGTLVAANYSFSFMTGQLLVERSVLTVTPLPTAMTYGGAIPDFRYVLSGFVNGEGVSLVSGAPGFHTKASSTSSVGVYVIEATTGTLTATNYSFAPMAGVITVNKAVLAIVPAASTMIYGSPLPKFAYSLVGFVGGDDSTVISGVATFKTTASSTSPVGVYAVQSLAGTLSAANYSFASASAIVTVNKAVLSIVPVEANMTYGSPLPSFGYTYIGFVNGDTPKVITGMPGFKTAASSTASVGMYPVTATLGTLTATNYAFASASGEITIGKATLEVTPVAATLVYGAELPKFAYSLQGFVNHEGTGVVTGSPVFQTNGSSAASVGVYSVQSMAGSLTATNYNFDMRGGTLTIQKAPLIVSSVSASMTYGGSVPTFVPAISGFVNGDTLLAVSGQPTFASIATSSANVGVYPVRVGIGSLSATNYSFETVNGALTVNPALLNVSARNETMIYGSAVPAMSYTLAGFVNGDTAVTAISGNPLLSTLASSTSSVGQFSIAAELGSLSANNYKFQCEAGIMLITKATLSVRAANLSMTAGATVPTLTYTVGGFVNGESVTSAVSGAPTLTTSATSKSTSGSYAISVAGGTLSANNYQFSLVNGTLTVTQ